MSNKRLRKTSDTVLSIVAAGIAIAALAVAVHQGMETRKHNRFSVRPSFDFTLEEYPGAELTGIFLKNQGLGPGIIKKLNAIVDGTYLPIGSSKEWRAVLQKLDIDETWAIIQSLGVGFTVKKEESLFLLAAKNEQLTSNRRMRFLRALDRLQFHVVYKSMYGEEFIRKTAFHKRP